MENSTVRAGQHSRSSRPNSSAQTRSSRQSISQIRPQERSQSSNQNFSHSEHSRSNHSAQNGSSFQSISQMRPQERSQSSNQKFPNSNYSQSNYSRYGSSSQSISQMRPADRSRASANQFYPDSKHSQSNSSAQTRSSRQSISQTRPSEKSQSSNQIFSHSKHSQSNYAAQSESSSQSAPEMRPSKRSYSTARSEHYYQPEMQYVNPKERTNQNADSSTAYDGHKYSQRRSNGYSDYYGSTMSNTSTVTGNRPQLSELDTMNSHKGIAEVEHNTLNHGDRMGDHTAIGAEDYTTAELEEITTLNELRKSRRTIREPTWMSSKKGKSRARK